MVHTSEILYMRSGTAGTPRPGHRPLTSQHSWAHACAVTMSSLSETAGPGHHQYIYLSRELEDYRADTDIGVRKERLVGLDFLSARSLQ